MSMTLGVLAGKISKGALSYWATVRPLRSRYVVLMASRRARAGSCVTCRSARAMSAGPREAQDAEGAVAQGGHDMGRYRCMPGTWSSLKVTLRPSATGQGGRVRVSLDHPAGRALQVAGSIMVCITLGDRRGGTGAVHG
jgi:hypothetical protein